MIPGAATDYLHAGEKPESIISVKNDGTRAVYSSIMPSIWSGLVPQRGTHQTSREYQLEDKLVVGSVARFMVQKNHTRMLEQFACLKKIYPNSHLLLAGEGELQAANGRKGKTAWNL